MPGRLFGLLVALAFCFPDEGLAGEGSATGVVTFERDIQPILTRAGCNAGACHGKASGQNGFKLSLLGFDSDFDHNAIDRDGGGRRVSRFVPDESLLLRKATAELPHGGGRRIEPGSPFYETLRKWIVQGLPRTPADSPRLVKVTVDPTERRVGLNESFNVRATAFYSDGSARDVTHLAAFASNDATLVAVDPLGVVKSGAFPGEATVSARFDGQFANCDVTIPLPGEISASVYSALPRSNFIDDLVWEKLQKLGLTPFGTSERFHLSAACLSRRHWPLAHDRGVSRLPGRDRAR